MHIELFQTRKSSTSGYWFKGKIKNCTTKETFTYMNFIKAVLFWYKVTFPKWTLKGGTRVIQNIAIKWAYLIQQKNTYNMLQKRYHGFLRGFSPTNFRSKIVSPSPFASPHWTLKIWYPPFCGSPHWFIVFKFPPPKIFKSYITHLHKRTSNTVSTSRVAILTNRNN